MADEVSEVTEVRLLEEIDELDEVSEVDYEEFMRSERLMSDDELDEDCAVCQADE